jgi:putative chitinase
MRRSLAAAWLSPIEEAMREYGIDTPLRQAAFLAQIGHESGGLQYASELWGPTLAQQRYEVRADLGNLQPGDGRRFRGHGLIQITGRYNHARIRDRLRERFPDRDVPDFEVMPEALALREWAALSAADYWDEHNLNHWADLPDFDGVSDMINRGRKTAKEGDANGFADRLARYQSALATLGVIA